MALFGDEAGDCESGWVGFDVRRTDWHQGQQPTGEREAGCACCVRAACCVLVVAGGSQAVVGAGCRCNKAAAAVIWVLLLGAVTAAAAPNVGRPMIAPSKADRFVCDGSRRMRFSEQRGGPEKRIESLMSETRK
ncbi:hypothetical protein BKA56DRAFT_612751 [Ilyonectria sp. MPI-CAGE-AT-0026]|nr:hypothetical protein BKA56DRAFT_612751 [Ilyonectria sp. MPI-CAGE-AT-0026]